VLFRWLRNSAVYSLGSLVLTLAVSVPAGYALALTEFRGRGCCSPSRWSS
jgi:multiple sugar transport system permease protein